MATLSTKVTIATNQSTAGRAELALRQWEFTGQRLLRLAAKAARDHHARIPTGYLDDAVGHLTEIGIRAAFDFDPGKALGFTIETPVDKRFEAFAYWRMRVRLIDWVRTTSNGNEFGRNGTLGRELLSEPDPDEAYPGWDDVTVDRAVRERFKTAASMSNMTMGEWAFQAMSIQADIQLAT